MSPPEVASALRLRLAAELRSDLRALEALQRATASLLVPAGDERGEWMRSLALAFEIERFYTAVEATLVRALRALDGDVPSGPTWHLALLHAASAPILGGRPALLDDVAGQELLELLKFRHLARHGYEAEPELARMEDHGRRVVRAFGALSVSLEAAVEWLEAVAP